MENAPTNGGQKKKNLEIVGGYIIPTNQKIEFPPENSSRIPVLSEYESEIIEFKLQGEKYIDIEEFRKAKEVLRNEKIVNKLREGLKNKKDDGLTK